MGIRIFGALVILSLTALSGIGKAQVQVGDKPAFAAKAIDGTPISLEALGGKMVLIDFWATWCGPCMAEAEHMVAVHRQYGDKGLCIIGVSLDRNQAAPVRVAKEKGFVWPQIFDPAGGNAISRQFGVTGIPRTFLIGPEGTVLWAGHPATMDAPLADAFRKHPPQLMDAKAVAEATEALGKAEAAADEGDAGAALRLFARLPAEARQNGAMAARIESLQKKLEGDAGKALDEAEEMVKRKEFGQAIVRLREISKLTGLPVAAKASQRAAAVMAMPEAKGQIAAADKAERERERGARAADALATARKLQGEKKHEEAYAAFKKIIEQFANTEAATAAVAEVTSYEKDPEFAKRVNAVSVERKANAMLSVAGSYKASGRNDLARQRYQAVIEQFPNTAFAETAKKELGEMPKE